MTPTRARAVAVALPRRRHRCRRAALPAPPRPSHPNRPPARRPSRPRPRPRCPPWRPVRGPLALRVVYPAPDAVLQVRDSSFLFGTAGSGDAEVTIDGQPARVWPNGAWLAYVALPRDSLLRLRIEARRGADSAALEYPLRRRLPDAGRHTVGAAWLDSLSLAPTGRLWLARGEYLTPRRRGPPKARPCGFGCPTEQSCRCSPQPQPLEVPATVRAFDARHDAPAHAHRPRPLRRAGPRACAGPRPRRHAAGGPAAPIAGTPAWPPSPPRRWRSRTAPGPSSRRLSAPTPRGPAGRSRSPCSTRFRSRPSSTTTRPAPV